ncbi:MAG TPA: diguanylate phosphodiesterase, partial [Gemmatimonadota bacterium]|nr:diguanylate phosphodiesterase [Gemmatimonadota bacterium]
RYDPILLKAFISLIGIYPPGTLVLLDTMEMAVVVAASSDHVARPRARLVTDPMGNRIHGALVNLSERDAAGVHVRTVIKVLDPERYRVDVGRYFLPS